MRDNYGRITDEDLCYAKTSADSDDKNYQKFMWVICFFLRGQIRSISMVLKLREQQEITTADEIQQRLERAYLSEGNKVD